MFGRVVFVATLCVTAALLGSFSLLERLPAPAPVAAAPAPAAVPSPSDNAAAEDAGRRVFSFRETALRADGRGQYAADALVNGLPVRMQGDCISKQGQEPGEVGFVPTGSLELAPE
jgi:hypothetical protein